MQAEQQHPTLPPELWQLIVARCAAKDQGSVGLVCKSWRRLSRPLGPLYLSPPAPGEQTAAALRWLLAHRHMHMSVTTRSDFVVQLLSTCTNVSQLDYTAYGSVDVVAEQLPGLEHLAVGVAEDLPEGGGDLSKLVNLRSLELGYDTVDVNLKDLGLQHLPHLSRLVYAGRFLDNQFEMPQLTQLRHLELLCDVIEYIPRIAAPNLQHLVVEGYVGFFDLDPLMHLVQLQQLSLRCTVLQDVAGLSTLVRLQQLEMYIGLDGGPQLDEDEWEEDEDEWEEEVVKIDVTPLAGLLQLRNLTLQCARLHDITPLSVLVGLHTLDLSHSAVTDVAPLVGLTNLRMLDVSHSRVKSLAPLAGLTNLCVLDVSHSAVTDVAPLAGLTNLRMLDVSHSDVKSLAPLRGLVTLGMAVQR